MKKLVFATQNSNKVKEINALLPEAFKIVSLKDIDCNEDIPETSNTLRGNALLKANYVKEMYHVDCFADDTGLEIEALQGAPGVYSARYAGPGRNAEQNMDLVLTNLKDETNRNAKFTTVIALIYKGKQFEFTGICKGIITKNKSGNGGFGYDPIFQPLGYQKTFAELSLEEKNKISHRGKAFAQLIDFLKNAT